MTSSTSFIFACVAVAALALGGCTSDRDRGPGTGGGVDSGSGSTDGGGSDTDGSTPGTDGSTPGTDGSTPGTDAGGTGTDAGSGAQGTCDPACLDDPGYCCMECDCSGTGTRCEPRCEAPYEWDCEMECCFNYETFECASTD